MKWNAEAKILKTRLPIYLRQGSRTCFALSLVWGGDGEGGGGGRAPGASTTESREFLLRDKEVPDWRGMPVGRDGWGWWGGAGGWRGGGGGGGGISAGGEGVRGGEWVGGGGGGLLVD